MIQFIIKQFIRKSFFVFCILTTQMIHAQVLIVSTLAGNTTSGSSNGTGTAASFNFPTNVATDVVGNVYVADFTNNMIRKISPSGVVTTVAGSTTSGSADGIGTAASFNGPYGLAVDTLGNIFVADAYNNKIRKITSAGVVSTFAGNLISGSTNGNGTAASFNNPGGLAIDDNGNLYVADRDNHMIRKISSTGLVTTLAGNTTLGSANGTGTAASFNQPHAVAVDSLGNVYVADRGNNKIRKITATGLVTTVAGSGVFGNANGSTTAASFYYPSGIAVDDSGYLYVADYINNTIRKIDNTGFVSTYAGFPTASGSNNGVASSARFYYPSGVTVSATGILYVADQGNNMIRKIANCTPNSSITNLSVCSNNLPYQWNGNTITTAGVYTATILNVGGCDSSLTLNLTINSIDSSVTTNSTDLHATQSGATYQWIDCNGNTAISGATNQNYTPTNGGSYAVIVSINGCIDTSNCHSFTPLGIEATAFNPYLIISPNPTDGYAKVELIESSALGTSIKIVDMSGRVIKEIACKMNAGKQSSTIDLSEIAAGLYTIQVFREDKRLAVSKLEKR